MPALIHSAPLPDRVWYLKSQDCKATLTGHMGSVNSLAVSPDNQMVVSASDDNIIRCGCGKLGSLLHVVSCVSCSP